MSLPRFARACALAGAAGAALLTCTPAAPAGVFTLWGAVCPSSYFKHCQEAPPHIWMTTGCPRRVCDPCNLEHAGYYHTCWQPWPWPPDYRHCPCSPCAMVQGMPAAAPPAETKPADKDKEKDKGNGGELPPPRKTNGVNGPPSVRLMN
jgi:hypothetical protein